MLETGRHVRPHLPHPGTLDARSSHEDDVETSLKPRVDRAPCLPHPSPGTIANHCRPDTATADERGTDASVRGQKVQYHPPLGTVPARLQDPSDVPAGPEPACRGVSPLGDRNSRRATILLRG